jgi:hypothetical protein
MHMPQRAAAVSGLAALTVPSRPLLGGPGLAAGIIGVVVGTYGLTRRRTS